VPDQASASLSDTSTRRVRGRTGSAPVSEESIHDGLDPNPRQRTPESGQPILRWFLASGEQHPPHPARGGSDDTRQAKFNDAPHASGTIVVVKHHECHDPKVGLTSRMAMPEFRKSRLASAMHEPTVTPVEGFRPQLQGSALGSSRRHPGGRAAARPP
jgi:hypothetical protein